MIQVQTKSQIKLNRRGLTELVLACAFLSLLTFALWSWQNSGYVAAAANSPTESDVSLVPLILRNPAIMASTVVTEFVLILALLLAVVPISWWLRSDYLIAGANARVMTPLRWLGELLRFRRAPQESLNGEFVTNEAGQLVFVPEQGVDGEVEPDVVMVPQPDGTTVAMVQQADGTLVPAEKLSKDAKKEGKEGEAEATELVVPLPNQADSALNFEETEEDDPMADLAGIGDILSSAFDEGSAVDPEREAMSRGLSDIEIEDLYKNARNVLATFKQ